MKNLLFGCCLLFLCVYQAQTQDSLAHYSLNNLDTLYENAKTPQERLIYALAMLKKGEQELSIQDTRYVNVLAKLGGAYLKTRDIKSAKSYLTKAVDLLNVKTPKSKLFMNSLSDLGVVYYYEGQFDKVEELWLKARDLRKEVLGSRDPKYVSSLNNLGALYQKMGNYEKAKSFYIEAMPIRKETLGEEHPKYANLLNNIAIIYMRTGDYGRAEAFYIKAMEIRKKTLGEKHPHYAETLNNLGALYDAIGDYEQSEAFYLQGMQIRKEVLGEKHSDYTSSLNNLGGLHSRNGDYKKAESFYIQTVKIRKEILGEKHPRYASALSNLGNVYEKMKRYEKVQPLYIEALGILKETLGEKHPRYASILRRIGTLYDKTENDEQAEAFYLQAMQLRKEAFGDKHPDYIMSLIDLGSVFIEKGQPEIALEYIQKAWYANTNRPLDQPITASTIANLAKTNIVSFESMDNILALLFVLSGNDSKREEQVLICDLALKLSERNKNELIGEDDKLRILKQSSKWVMRSMMVLDKDKNAAKAFNVIEQNKSVLLLNVTNNKQIYTSGILPEELIRKEKDLQKKYSQIKADISKKRPEQELDSLRALLTSLNIEIANFQKKLKQDYPKYANIRYSYEPIQVEEVQTNLNAETALLEYLVTDSIVYVFYVDKKKMAIHEFPIRKIKLQQKIKGLHNALSNYSIIAKDKTLAYSQYTTAAYWFYKELVAPVLANVTGIEQLIIVTDEELGHLPFETFLVERAPQNITPYNKLHYLINDYKISYNYSATLWNRNRKAINSSNNNQILGIAANYDFSLNANNIDQRLPVDLRLRTYLSPLPSAREEVRILEQKYQGVYLFDTLASEKLFKQKATDFGIIHLAMHGLLNKREKALSSLAFTEDNDSLENNFLHAYEISKMELNADLVVLSACETGYGKFEEGNGIASLASAFIYAGVPSMIVSLWQVNDEATALIMERLYSNFAEGMPKDAALRKAKLDYIQSAKGIAGHPAFWSAFVLMGNEGPVSISEKGGLNWLGWGLGVGALMLLGLGVFLRKSKKEVS
ncbi:MAG: CHAT domain-containing protein [Aureispira sp.]|nr:CHAT domain-containing protein [Aureispira sp.]